jgi:hypothetical protein
MPKRDGTGPSGNGSMTGRGDGSCIVPLNTTKQKIEFLKKRDQYLKKQRQNIKNRIKCVTQGENKKENTI